jgi:hypothetical protein
MSNSLFSLPDRRCCKHDDTLTVNPHTPDLARRNDHHNSGTTALCPKVTPDILAPSLPPRRVAALFRLPPPSPGNPAAGPPLTNLVEKEERVDRALGIDPPTAHVVLQLELHAGTPQQATKGQGSDRASRQVTSRDSARLRPRVT